MRDCFTQSAKSTLVPAVLAAVLCAAPAWAQKGTQTGPAQHQVPAAANQPLPTLDEGTAQRMAATMLTYSASEVRGGWPTIPANAKLAPGASGPDVTTLRQRLAITDDLAPELAAGPTYDDAVS